MPQLVDQLQIRRNMSTGALSTSFPFTSADLSQDTGILYGINMHNSGLVIFDRFSWKTVTRWSSPSPAPARASWSSWKPCAVMMFGTEIFIIDPENEYQRMCDAVGGAYVRLSLSFQHPHQSL